VWILSLVLGGYLVEHPGGMRNFARDLHDHHLSIPRDHRGVASPGPRRTAGDDRVRVASSRSIR
jgi:hypothetical protein